MDALFVLSLYKWFLSINKCINQEGYCHARTWPHT